MEKEKVLQKLFSLHQFGIKLGLENIQKLLDQINNPHYNLKCFHVAGSNGKGSTSSFIASILMEMGFKVGLYTSPHFVNFNERIRINGKEIEDNYIIDFIDNLNEYVENEKPTFFEITTAMAFKYFDEKKVDYAVIETGLGGRLDATNVIMPISSIITSISLEHTEHLGNTLEQIAFEKGGIIKNEKPVFIGKLPKDAEDVILKISQERKSKLFRVIDFIEDYNFSLLVKCKNFNINLYKTPLLGKHQLYNAALAIKTIDENFQVQSHKILNGIKKVIKNTSIQGRYEVYNNFPKVIFDSAHNPEGIQSFIEEFKKEKFYEKRILIFSVMKDKNSIEMIKMLKDYFDEIYFYELNFERSARYFDIKEIGKKENIIIRQIHSPENYLNDFINNKKNNCLVFLGSMYLLGEIKSKIISK
ncbi:MAG: bifunctional folylpolyglutamate synthase/dihydrofolate synthase [Melioribacteraceae bacterium]|nr:bifunctional folylpolyglutamate synthase/dihydrofolate synthase [Melioribacteraceae bacterium]